MFICVWIVLLISLSLISLNLVFVLFCSKILAFIHFIDKTFLWTQIFQKEFMVAGARFLLKKKLGDIRYCVTENIGDLKYKKYFYLILNCGGIWCRRNVLLMKLFNTKVLIVEICKACYLLFFILRALLSFSPKIKQN